MLFAVFFAFWRFIQIVTLVSFSRLSLILYSLPTSGFVNAAHTQCARERRLDALAASLQPQTPIAKAIQN
jgi:hypothetical protein